jgi:hypothetical protein
MKTYPFDRVLLVVFALVVGFASRGVAEESTGKFKNVLADKETFVVKIDDAERTFQLAAKARVFINDRETTLSELKPGDEVAVTWQERDERKVASLVKCTRK